MALRALPNSLFIGSEIIIQWDCGCSTFLGPVGRVGIWTAIARGLGKVSDHLQLRLGETKRGQGHVVWPTIKLQAGT